MPGAHRCRQEKEGRVNLTVVLSLLLIALGAATIVRTLLLGVGGGLGLVLGTLLVGAGAARALHRSEVGLMARKLSLERALGPTALAAVAYGEVGSSLYFALGIVALYALGLTPFVLLVVGVLFLIVAASYAEGAAAIPETGGAATFVRRAFNDPLGFVTGWVLFLDYLIVVALAGLFTPHYVGTAVGWDALTRRPWDALVGVLVILGLAASRLVRRTQIYRVAIAVAGVALATHVLLIVLGGVFILAREGFEIGSAPGWGELAFALPLAMLAYTGLETVAKLRLRDPRARQSPASRAVRRPRHRRRRLGSARIDRPLGVSGRERLDGARRRVAAGSARRDRGRARRRPAELARGRHPRHRRPDGSDRPGRRRDDARSRAPAGSRTRWRATRCCRGRSRG